MSSPQLQEVLAYFDEWNAQVRRIYSSEKPDMKQARELAKEACSKFSRMPERVSSNAVTADGVPCEWVCDIESDPDRRLLYLHGGGWRTGDIEGYRPLAGWISKASGCAVLNVGYRLAPENLFPAGLEDCVTAYRWMLENGPSGPSQARHSFIAGDSAGGGLTLSALLALRDKGIPLPDAAATLSAFIDFTLSSGAWPDEVLPHLELMAKFYLGDGDRANPLASPLLGDPTGLPPLLFQVGAEEPHVKELELFAQKAEQAGVDITLELWPEMPHVWQLFAPLLPEANQAIDRIGSFFRNYD